MHESRSQPAITLSYWSSISGRIQASFSTKAQVWDAFVAVVAEPPSLDDAIKIGAEAAEVPARDYGDAQDRSTHIPFDPAREHLDAADPVHGSIGAVFLVGAAALQEDIPLHLDQGDGEDHAVVSRPLRPQVKELHTGHCAMVVQAADLYRPLSQRE